jgi:cardiolipin synthase A/B
LFAREAARKLSTDLLAAGVRLFELQGQALHAKAAVADGEHLLVGSFDYNRFSAQKSLEVVVSVEDPATGGTLRDLFLQNQERCEEVTLERLDRQSGLRRALQTASLKAFEFAGRI